MKKLLTIILAFLPVLIFSQIKYDSVRVVKPQNFVEALSIDTAIVQIISQKAGVNRRVNFQTVADWILAQQPNLDSAQYANDTLLLFYGPDTILAIIPSGTIDTAYLSGDTLGIVFAGDTTEVVLAGLGDGNGLFDPANDGDTTGVGSVVLGEDLTVELNNHDWLFDGLVEDDTTSRIMTLRGDGSLAYRWLDSLLNGYTTGSGTPGTLPIWTGANALGNSSLTESGGDVVGTSFTGAFRLAVGTDAQRPVGANGLMRYSTTGNDIQAWNGAAAAWQYLPWADAGNWSSGRIPYSNGGSLTSSTTMNFTAGGIRVDNGGAAQYAIYGTHTTSNSAALRGDGRNPLFLRPATEGAPAIFISNSGWNNSSINTSVYTRPRVATPDMSVTPQSIANGYGVAIFDQALMPAASPKAGYIFNVGRVFSYVDSVQTVTRRAVTSWRIQTHCDSNSLFTAAIFYGCNKGNRFPAYGSGNISGTPTYSISTTSNGTYIEVPEKWGAISTSTDGSGDIVVAHGMGTTPTSVQVTVTGTTPYVVTVHTIGSTNFTVRFYDMTGAAVASTAVTATWHAKT